MTQDNGAGDGGTLAVLIEVRVPKGLQSAVDVAESATLSAMGVEVDRRYPPVPMRPTAEQAASMDLQAETIVVVRGTVPSGRVRELEAQPHVLRVYRDTPIAPFTAAGLVGRSLSTVEVAFGAGDCPIPPCDCSPTVARGGIRDVAGYLGVDDVWAVGLDGSGIVVAVVDGGITALGRTPAPGEVARVQRVVGGWPGDWGTTSASWGEHGNMTATDVLGMAPGAAIYDIRIAEAGIQGTIAAALSGYQWAIDRHRSDGTPQILTNSWGIYQESWDPVYARDPSHVFTRKVVEAIEEGLLVLFAAGNCGEACHDPRCGSDVGSGRSIWGANGHPRVMTVAAANPTGQYVGYGGVGPAALSADKPDFCGLTHFAGYFPCDSGTSAATPVVAGVTALLKQAKPDLTQDEVKALLRRTARDIGPTGWDRYTGSGIIQAKAAVDAVTNGSSAQWSEWRSLGGLCVGGLAATSQAPQQLDVFATGARNAVLQKSLR